MNCLYIHLTTARKVNPNTHISGGKGHCYVRYLGTVIGTLSCQRTDSRTVICDGRVTQIAIPCVASCSVVNGEVFA